MFLCLCDRCNTFINIRRKVLLSSVGFRKRMTSHSPRGIYLPGTHACFCFDRPLCVWWSDGLCRGLILLFRSSLNWFNQEDATASVWKWCFNVSPRSSLLVNREGPFSGCYSVTSLEWPRMEWHSIGPEQSMKSIIDCHRLIFRSSIFIDCSGPAFKKNYTNKQKKIKWTAAPSNNFFKILAGIIENCPYGNVCLCWIIMNACNNNNNNTLFQYPTLIYVIQKIDINTERVQGAHNNHIED